MKRCAVHVSLLQVKGSGVSLTSRPRINSEISRGPFSGQVISFTRCLPPDVSRLKIHVRQQALSSRWTLLSYPPRGRIFRTVKEQTAPGAAAAFRRQCVPTYPLRPIETEGRRHLEAQAVLGSVDRLNSDCAQFITDEKSGIIATLHAHRCSNLPSPR